MTRRERRPRRRARAARPRRRARPATAASSPAGASAGPPPQLVERRAQGARRRRRGRGPPTSACTSGRCSAWSTEGSSAARIDPVVAGIDRIYTLGTRGILAAPWVASARRTSRIACPRVVPKEETDISHLSDEMADLLYPGRRPRPFRIGVRFERLRRAGLRAGGRARARARPSTARRRARDGHRPPRRLRRRRGADAARPVRARAGAAGHRGARRRQEGALRPRAVAAALLDLRRRGGLSACRSPEDLDRLDVDDPPAAGEVGPLLQRRRRRSRRRSCRRRSRRSSGATPTPRSATTASASATRA